MKGYDMDNITFQYLLKQRFNLLLNDMELFKKKILNNYGQSENLHQFRVSIRKIRVLLSLLNKYIKNKELTKAKKDFRYLAKLTNEPRDLDVYILKFNSYKTLLPNKQKKDLDILVPYLKKKRDVEYQKLISILLDNCYKDIIKNIKILIENKYLKRKSKQAIKVSNINLSKQYKCVILKGIDLNKNSFDYQFHKLRIECKKLRYLIELYSPLYSKKNYAKIIQKIKIIQTLLGDFNDYCVHQSKLESLVKEFNITGDALEAVKYLIIRFKIEQNIIKVKFNNKFKKFYSSNFKNLLLNFRVKS